MADRARHRPRRRGREQPRLALEAGRPRRRHRLGPRRAALGRAHAASAPVAGLAVAAARGLHDAAVDGHRHRRLHRRAVRDGAAPPRARGRRRRGAGDRRGRRRRIDCGRAARRPRLSRRRLDRPPAGGRLPEGAWARPRTVDRNELAQPGKPLQKERWAGVVDAVGSHTLVNAWRRRAGTARWPPAAWRRAPTFPAR